MSEQNKEMMKVRGGVISLRSGEIVQVLVGVVKPGGRETGNAKHLFESGGKVNGEVTWSTCAFRDFLCDEYLQLTLRN